MSEWRVEGRYRNLDGRRIPPPGAPLRVLKWQLGPRTPAERPEARDEPVPPVDPDGRLSAPAPLQVTWLGHATVLVQAGGASIVTDPVFGHVGFGTTRRLAPAPLAAEALPALDAILVSHNHYDHCDVPSLKALRARNPEAPLLVPSGLDAWAAGAIGGPVRAVEWWHRVEVGGARVHAVPAQHWSWRRPGDQCRTHWCGFVVEGPGGSAYFAGDTGFGPHFAAIAERHAIDVAALPIGAYAPRWFMSDQHMGPAEAVEAARLLGAHLLPIHWGTFRLTDEPLDEPPRLALAAAEAAGVGLTVVHPGGGVARDGGGLETWGRWRWAGAAG